MHNHDATHCSISRRRFMANASATALAAGLVSDTVGALGQDSSPVKVDSADEIWDLHGHLSGIAGKTPEERMERLLEFADCMNIRRLCIYMGMNFSYDPSPDELRKQNDEVLRALRVGGERTLGFVYLSPKYVRESLDELERCVNDGPMVGVKLWVAMHCDAPQIDSIIDRATQLKAVIFQHTWIKITGNLSGESTPMDLAILADRHPEAQLICGHAGGDWEQGIRAVRAKSNVAVDLGGGDPVSGFTEMAVRELGEERVIYGSDIPGRAFATQLAKVYGTNLPIASQRLILAGNLKRLLTPILTDKGIPI